MSAPTKRTLTNALHDSLVASNTPHNDLLSDDLYTRLQNVGSRVRKSVTEGYNTQRYVSTAPPSPKVSAVRFTTGFDTSGSVFCPANATLHEVFGSPGTITSPASSPRKRAHTEVENQPNPVNDAEDGDVDMLTENTEADTTSYQRPDGVNRSSLSTRAIRPLRRTREGFKAIHSLPEGLLGLPRSGDSTMLSTLRACDVMEEDWSKENFADSPIESHAPGGPTNM